MRPDWDKYFIDIAKVVSTRATCNRAHAGGVVTDEAHSILLTGYNGSLPGEAHCPPDEDLSSNAHCPRVLHVENNITIQAARRGISLRGGIWYFWPFGPCINCQKKYIIPTGGSRVVFPYNDKTPFSADYIEFEALIKAGIKVDVVPNWLP